MKKYRTFRDFYPYYLSQHANPLCRGLHVVGSLIALGIFIYACATAQPWLILLALAVSYGFAWTGHFVFERNMPATFTHPVYSFMADWVMVWQSLLDRLPAQPESQDTEMLSGADMR